MKKKYLLSKLLLQNFYHNEKASPEFHRTMQRDLEVIDGEIIASKRPLRFSLLFWILILWILIIVLCYYLFFYLGYTFDDIWKLLFTSSEVPSLSKEEQLLQSIKDILMNN